MVSIDFTNATCHTTPFNDIRGNTCFVSSSLRSALPSPRQRRPNRYSHIQQAVHASLSAVVVSASRSLAIQSVNYTGQQLTALSHALLLHLGWLQFGMAMSPILSKCLPMVKHSCMIPILENTRHVDGYAA